MAERRLVGSYPVIGIRPTIDGRRGALDVRGSLEEQTMNMAKSAAKLFEENLRYSNGEPVKVVIADTTIGRVGESAACADKFRREGVDITVTVTPCWCYGAETMDMDPQTIKAVWGFNGTERPGAVYLASVLATHAQKGLPAFGIYGHDVQEADDTSIPEDVKEKLLRFGRAAVAAASTAGVFQFCCQTNGFPFCCYKRSAVGIAAAVKQIGHSSYVGFCGTKQCHFQCVGAGSICAADGAAVSSAEFQCVVKHIPQFQIPAAFPESVGAFAQNVDSAQFRIVHGNSCCIDGGNDDVAVAHHVVAAIHAAANTSCRTQNVRTQTFLNSALVEDFLCDDAGFVLVVVAVAAAASCGDFRIIFKFKSSHKTASFGYCDWILLYTMWLCEMGAFNRHKKYVVEKHLYLCDGFGEFFCKKGVIITISS